MSLKDKFESSPVVFGLSLVLIGFVAGFTVRGYVLPASPPTVVSCTVNGLDSFTDAHLGQMQPLQSELVRLEALASDRTLILTYQRIAREGAARIRKDIEAEQANYQSALKTLRKSCE